jgi:hypothetical protein
VNRRRLLTGGTALAASATYDSTSDFGVGAFLLGGAELALLMS